MKKFGVLVISTLVLFIGVVILSFFISDRLIAYKNKKEQIAEELGMEERLLSAGEYIPFLGDFIEDQKVKDWQLYEKQAKANYNGGLLYGLFLFLFVGLYVGVNKVIYKKQVEKARVMGFVMVFAALSFLYLGLMSPLMEMMAYKKDLAFAVSTYEFQFDGRIYFLYQNKSIIQLIGLLYTGGNFLVAFAVAIFSVGFPIIKLSYSLAVLAYPKKPISIKRYKLIRNLGKWSMADVFVVSVFLAYFAYSNMNIGIDTGSETLIGTYFYIAFVIISISSGMYLKKAMKQAQNVTEEAFD